MSQHTPATPNPPRFVPQGLIPTAEQTAIQLARNKVALVAANAGAAKTTTLALRIGEAIARKLAPEQILALTFTPEARDVMRQRLVEVGLPWATASRVDVATFEQFAERALAQSEGGPAPRLEALRQLKPYALEALERVSHRYQGRVEYLDIRTHNIALSQFLDTQLALKASMLLETVDAEYLGLEEAAEQLNTPLADYLATVEYETLRKGGDEEVLFRGPYDATYDLACQLTAMPDSAHALPAYRVVVCDELHDLNEAAFRILHALISRPDCWFVGAGDVDQVIHSKLGASVAFMEQRFAERYAGVQRYPLTHTWRHGPHLAYAMRELKAKPVESRLPLHTAIVQAHYADPGACGQRVVEAIKAWKKDGGALEGVAVLLRDRHQSMAVETALMQARIGYRTPPMAGYLQRPEILFLRGMIAIALDDLASVKSVEVRAAMVEALAIFGELPLAPQRLEAAQREIARHPQLLREFHKLYIAPGDGDGGAAGGAAGGTRSQLAAAIAYAAGVDPASPADAPLRAICAQMDIEQAAKRIFLRPYEASVVTRSLAGFIDAAAASGQSLADFWQALNTAEAFASRKREKDFVLLEVAANAKGKEFAHVILPFLETGEFPSRLADPLEEENLYYVAATRAKERLTLLSPDDAARRSPYLARMRLAAIAAEAEQAIARNEAPPAQGPTRYYLNASIHEAPQVKALGARFDWPRKAWYVEPGTDLEPFRRWLRN